MFDGVPEQLHQFIASSRTTTTLPLPSLSFSSPSSLHHHHHHHGSSSNPTNNNNTIFPNFDPLFITGTNISSPQVQVQLLPLHQVQVQQQPNSFLLHPFTHNQQSQPQKSSEDHLKQQESDRLVVVSNMSNNLESNSSAAAAANWSNDEVLALLRIRSSLDNWFPESTWAHVSRKLEEVGYKRSAEKCKEKFEEEESRYLSNINYNKISSHCRFFNEFEDFYSNISHGQNPHDHHHHHHHHENIKKLEIKPTEEQEQDQEQEQEQKQQDKNLLLVDGLKLDSNKKDQKGTEIKKKRKRVQQKKKEEEEEEEFEMLKGFCEDIVKQMMVQQEEMHEKLVEDMVKRDEEKFVREEAWKKVEMDKINKQLEIRAHEQAIVSDRQATLIKFLKSFTTTTTTSSSTSSSSGTSNGTTSNNSDHHHHHQNRRSSEESPVDKVPIIAQNNPNDHQVQNPTSNHDDDHHHPNPKLPTSQNPNSDPTQMIKKSPLSPPTTTTTSAVAVSTQTTALILSNDDHHDTGKRWPRDEVFALINMRCSLHNNNGDQQDKEGQANKIPLWERISQGMSQLGYKRSSKRCKEKWENINKYFRKTKDNVNKKRSLDSRTCPYFHQLSTLYNQGTLVVPPSSNEGATGNIPATFPENLPAPAGSNSQAGSSSTDSTAIHVDGHHDQAQGEKILVQVPTFDFEF